MTQPSDMGAAYPAARAIGEYLATSLAKFDAERQAKPKAKQRRRR